MEALDAVALQQVASRADLPLDEIDVALPGLEQVATALRGDRRHMQQCLTQTFADRYPAWCGGASATSLGAVCDVDAAVLFGFAPQARQVGQDGFAQAQAALARQMYDGGHPCEALFS